MDIQFYGANCISLTTKQARVVIDDNLSDLGLKTIARPGDIALFTSIHADPSQLAKVVIDQPGEYEVSGVSIYGIPARAHIDEAGNKNAIMYKLVIDDMRILVTGHIYPELSDAQLEKIGIIDIMFVPVGGNGYTLDGIGALKIAKKVEPKVVIPTHYDMPAVSLPVVQQPLEEALKAMSMEIRETLPKLKIKQSDLIEGMQLIVIERS